MCRALRENSVSEHVLSVVFFLIPRTRSRLRFGHGSVENHFTVSISKPAIPGTSRLVMERHGN